MSKVITIIIVLYLCSFSLNSCAFDDKNTIKEIQKHVPNLQIEYVIQTAKEYLKAQDRKIENYFVETTKYDSLKKEWTIFFLGKTLSAGNHLLIFINDRTKEIELIPGM